VESTLAEVLILKRLGEIGFYKIVNRVGRKILGGFLGTARRSHMACGSLERVRAPNDRITITYWY
jgi:hypothetical protein